MKVRNMIIGPVLAVLSATTPALADWHGPAAGHYRYGYYHERSGIGPGAALGLGMLGGAVAGALIAPGVVYPPVYVAPPVYVPPPVIYGPRCVPTGWGYAYCGW